MKLKEKIKALLCSSVSKKSLVPDQDFSSYTLSVNHLIKMIMFDASKKFIEVMSEDEIVTVIRTAIANNKDIADIYAALANLLVNAGQPDLALDYFSKSLILKSNLAVHSLYLQSLIMTEATNKTIFNACTTYVAKHYKYNTSANNKLAFSHKPKDKKLRIGYACHFLHNSVAASIILPFIKSHDRKKVEIYCYYDWNKSDERADMISIANHWRNTKDLNDDEFFNLVQNDDIDVFVEMNGHTVINRYGVCMRRVAPIQISFYNWAATSGIPNMDYNIVDSKVLDPSEDKYFTEKIYRLPNAYGIAIFSDTFPNVSPSPHVKNGYITFGSFGSAHKVNEKVIKLWCDVLHAVPNSKFFMKAGVLSTEFYQNNFYRYFANNGIGKDRLIFEGWSDHHEMLKRYADVDIALDTFPYCGSTTTLEAIWQGVPVITYSGNRLSTKSGMSILTNLGFQEYIAQNKDDVIKIASKLAGESNRLVELRSSTRDIFKKSNIYNASLFASDLENAYYNMWNHWYAEISNNKAESNLP